MPILRALAPWRSSLARDASRSAALRPTTFGTAPSARTAAARRVMESGKPERLSPMSPFERKVVHDAVASIEGVHSESEGEEPKRKVVVHRVD